MEVEFSTSRLCVRRIDDGDADAMFDVYGDPEVVRFVGDRQVLTRARCQECIDVTKQNYSKRGYGMFATVEQGSDFVVGFCGLVHPNSQKDAEIKYAYRQSCWGRGYATEVATELLRYAAELHHIAKVVASVALGNLRSQHVLDKAGMSREGLRQNSDGSSSQMFVWRPVAPAFRQDESNVP